MKSLFITLSLLAVVSFTLAAPFSEVHRAKCVQVVSDNLKKIQDLSNFPPSAKKPCNTAECLNVEICEEGHMFKEHEISYEIRRQVDSIVNEINVAYKYLKSR